MDIKPDEQDLHIVIWPHDTPSLWGDNLRQAKHVHTVSEQDIKKEPFRLSFPWHHFDLGVSAGPPEVRSLYELCRVAKEVRLFPFLGSKQGVADELGALLLELQSKNINVSLEHIDAPEARNVLLKAWANECIIEV